MPSRAQSHSPLRTQQGVGRDPVAGTPWDSTVVPAGCWVCPPFGLGLSPFHVFGMWRQGAFQPSTGHGHGQSLSCPGGPFWGSARSDGMRTQHRPCQWGLRPGPSEGSKGSQGSVRGRTDREGALCWVIPFPGPTLRGMLGQFWARFDPRIASESPTYALFGASWACFGPFRVQVGVPPKWPISGPKHANRCPPPPKFLDPSGR